MLCGHNDDDDDDGNIDFDFDVVRHTSSESCCKNAICVRGPDTMPLEHSPAGRRGR